MAQYNIGDIFLELNSDLPFQNDRFCDCFLSSYTAVDTAESIIYDTRFSSLSWVKNAKMLERNGTYELYSTPDEKILIYHWASCRFAYGFSRSTLYNGDTVKCWIDPEMQVQPPLTASHFISTAGLHTKLLQRNAPILHASYIDCGGKAILFTAPSGTGKSTQADLWVQHAGAEIINGDRVLLRQRDGVWHAFGYPCCGSSSICLNRTLPLAAIVVLMQGAENRIEVMRPGEMVRALFGGIERYLWDPTETDLAFSLARQLALDVPILRLVCRPDADAVLTLQSFLSKEGLI